MYYDRFSPEAGSYTYHCEFYRVTAETPDDGDLIGDGNDVADDGDLLGDDDEEVDTEAVSETDETKDTTETDAETTTDEDEVILLEVKCNIQKTDKLMSSGTVMADYEVYYPWGRTEGKVPFVIGDKFRCNDYSFTPLQGTVLGIVDEKPYNQHIQIRVNSF